MRTEVLEVRSIIDTGLTDAEINMFIKTASRIITNTVASEVDPDTAKDIETWVTAHLIAISKERQASEEEIGDAKVKYQGQYGMAWESTSYGQMALTMDPSGKLQSAGKKRASIRAYEQWPEGTLYNPYKS